MTAAAPEASVPRAHPSTPAGEVRRTSSAARHPAPSTSPCATVTDLSASFPSSGYSQRLRPTCRGARRTDRRRGHRRGRGTRRSPVGAQRRPQPCDRRRPRQVHRSRLAATGRRRSASRARGGRRAPRRLLTDVPGSNGRRGPVHRRLWHRLPWLALGLLGAMASAGIVAAFEEQLPAGAAGVLHSGSRLHGRCGGHADRGSRDPRDLCRRAGARHRLPSSPPGS